MKRTMTTSTSDLLTNAPRPQSRPCRIPPLPQLPPTHSQTTTGIPGHLPLLRTVLHRTVYHHRSLQRLTAVRRHDPAWMHMAPFPMLLPLATEEAALRIPHLLVRLSSLNPTLADTVRRRIMVRLGSVERCSMRIHTVPLLLR